MDAQFKKGVLEICVLSQLKNADRYGYELTEAISQKIDVTAGTLYLVLRRLKNNGYVETYLRESASGPARKYYHLTDRGHQAQEAKEKEWRAFTASVGELLDE